MEMLNKRILTSLQGPGQCQFGLNTVYSSLLPEQRHTPSNLDVRHHLGTRKD